MSAPSWAKGMQRLSPGVYADGEGAMHIDDKAVCAHFGVPATPENCEAVTRAIAAAVKAKCPEARHTILYKDGIRELYDNKH